MPLAARLAVLAVLSLSAGLGGCRASEGEACLAPDDCHPDLRCHRKVCKTPQQVAKLKMAENDARWAAKKREVLDTMAATKKQIGKLKEKLAEADTEAERERLEKMVDELQKTNAPGGSSRPPAPGSPPAP